MLTEARAKPLLEGERLSKQHHIIVLHLFATLLLGWYWVWAFPLRHYLWHEVRGLRESSGTLARCIRCSGEGSERMTREPHAPKERDEDALARDGEVRPERPVPSGRTEGTAEEAGIEVDHEKERPAD